jgi:hypothetical protein
MDEDVQRRIASNESVFRRINEGIERGQWPGDEASLVGFRCECAQLGCNSVVELTIAEYEDVRAHPRRFVVAPDHAFPEAERVVDARPNFVVVEKRDQAGAAAEASDPRR